MTLIEGPMPRRRGPPKRRTPAPAANRNGGKVEAQGFGGRARSYREDPAPATVVATIRKNAEAEVRVSLGAFNDFVFVDVRQFADVGDGERTATRKGVALAVARLPELRAALEAAEAVARERGLLDGEDGR